MKKTTLSIIATLAMTTGLWAIVPYTFTPNTPAKASEVNANFKALSDKIVTLENNVTDIVSGGGDNICFESPHSYTYNYTPSSIGDTITVRGIEYIIVAMPFIEYGTEDHYFIQYPAEKQGSDPSKNMSVYTYIYTNHAKADNECHPFTFSGFPASDYTKIRYGNNYRARMEDPADSGSTYGASKSASGSVSIKINQTHLSISTSIYEYIQQTPIASGDVDMRDDLDWSKMGIDTTLINDVKTLMNHIKIEKLP